MNDKARILLVEDDPHQSLLMARWIQGALTVVVDTASSASEARTAMIEREYQVALIDIGLPDASGVDLSAEFRRNSTQLSIALISADVDVDAAVSALRNGIDDVFSKFAPRDELLAEIEKLLSLSQRRSAVAAKGSSKRVILAIGAHPDDVEIGCGGTLIRHSEEGDEVHILTLTQGARGGECQARSNEARLAASQIGATLHLESFQDTQLGDEVIPTLVSIVARLSPDVVYVHGSNDTHQDHRALHAATLVATRKVPTVLCYQSPSSTIDFRPTMFRDIGAYLERKLSLIASYRSQQHCSYVAPESVRASATYWARFAGTEAVEPFSVIRFSDGPSPAVSSRVQRNESTTTFETEQRV